MPAAQISTETGASPTGPLENARRAVQQLLLPVVDLVRMNPERTRQLSHCPVALNRRQRHLRFERRVVLLPCLLHVLLLRHQRLLGAGLHLNQLSLFRGPAHCVVDGTAVKVFSVMKTGHSVASLPGSSPGLTDTPSEVTGPL